MSSPPAKVLVLGTLPEELHMQLDAHSELKEPQPEMGCHTDGFDPDVIVAVEGDNVAFIEQALTVTAAESAPFLVLAKDRTRIEKYLELGAQDCVPLDAGIQHVSRRLENLIELATLRKREGALVADRESALRANQSKSAFLANMSHELRTPMTAILGFGETLVVDDDVSQIPPHRLEAARTIMRNAEHLLGLINSILDFSKIEAGKMEMSLARYSPARLVDEVYSITHGQAAKKGIELSVECQYPLPETISTDPLRARQVLINLVGNAIKFTDTGSVHVTVRFDENNGDSRVHFDVADTGVGMSADQVANLFKPFTQVDTSAARRFKGTGLGLAISKRIAGMLGGDVTVSSTPGEGSVFTATIETHSLEGVTMVTEAPVKKCATREHKPVAKGPKINSRVLLAEDGVDNQRLISFILKKAGAEVTVVDDGQKGVESALQALKSGKPYDVILMDMQMPVLDGYTATRELREQGYERPIIALTAHAMSGDRDKCLKCGCDEYTTKPVDRAHLLELVQAYTQRTQSTVHS